VFVQVLQGDRYLVRCHVGRFSRKAVLGSVLGAVLALLAGLVSASPASASTQRSSGLAHYLALGDSVPFGYNPLLRTPGVDPHVFVGYPRLAGHLARPRLQTTDAACPGETSTSFITGTRPDNGCQDYRQFIGDLHVSYTGSQLEFAEHYVATHKRTRVISMMIGANDLFLLQDSCASAPDVNACVLAGLPALLNTLAANLTSTYSVLRSAGFRGEFIAVTYYSTDYSDPVVTGAVSAVNSVLAGVTTAFGGDVADGFSAFAAAVGSSGSTCDAGLLIHLTPTTCDVHPSPKGARLLAATVAKAIND
jgi:lysophospholipase L1-like esterase